MTELFSFVIPSPLPGHGGWGNGYVAIPEEHPYYGKHYTDVDNIDINGGLTYSSPYMAGRDPLEADGMWIFGFDTLHPFDTRQRWPTHDSVLKEANELKRQLMDVII